MCKQFSFKHMLNINNHEEALNLINIKHLHATKNVDFQIYILCVCVCVYVCVCVSLCVCVCV